MANGNEPIDNQGAIKRYMLRDEIKEYRIDVILRGKYQPGECLPGFAPARHFGVSQAPSSLLLPK